MCTLVPLPDNPVHVVSSRVVLAILSKTTQNRLYDIAQLDYINNDNLFYD